MIKNNVSGILDKFSEILYKMFVNTVIQIPGFAYKKGRMLTMRMNGDQCAVSRHKKFLSERGRG